MSHSDTKNISKGIYKAKSGQIIEENKSREAEPMMMMFNLQIRSKLDYCCLIQNPVKQILTKQKDPKEASQP